MKKFLIIAAGLLLVVILVLIAIPFFIDINSFRPKLEEQASQALGRQVKLGNLSLSIFTGSVGADDIEIADDPAFSQGNFLTAKSVRIAVAMHELIFQRQVNVLGVTIEKPQVALIKGAEGTWNFSSLNTAANATPDKPAAKAPPISVASFILNDGTVTVGQLNATRPPMVYDKVHVAVTNLSSTTPFQFQLTALLPGGGDADLSGTAGPIGAADAAKTPLDITIRVHDVHLAAYGLVPQQAGIDGIANLDEALHYDGTIAQISGTFSGSHMKLAPKGVASPTVISVQHDLEMNLAEQSGTLKQATISIGKAQIHESGTFVTKNGMSEVDLLLTGTNMPMDEFQSIVPALDVKMPNGSHMKGGTATIRLRVKGPIDAPVISGHISTANTTQVGFNLGQALGSAANYAGKTISSPDTFTKSMSFDILITPAGIKVENINCDVPSVSTATGSGTITPDGQLNFAMITYPTSGVAGGLQKMSGGRGQAPMTITGTAEKPVFTADTKAATKSMVSGAAKGVGASIGNIFKKKPKDKTDSTQPPPK